MAFKIIEGSFHVVGYSPDGDSVRFQPTNPETLALLDGPKAKVNAKGHVQLRLEAIDTLETHYLGFHQPLDLAEGAMKELMRLLGIEKIKWNDNHSKIISAKDGTPGFIIAREVEKNGRPVSFVFAGKASSPDGSDVFVKPATLEHCVNTAMLKKGFAYPTYYTGLFSDLRKSFTKVVAEAREGTLGVWKHDVTNAGFDATGLDAITNKYIMLPKLFRRLATYLEGGGSASGFKDYMEGLKEKITIISSAHVTHFDTIIEEKGDHIRMTQKPENVMFAG